MATTNFHIPILCIAGNDPSGGAGVLSDIATCASIGCRGLGVITALTAQNHLRVDGSLSVSGFLPPQLDSLLTAISPAAVKTGMLPDPLAVEATADAIRKYRLRNIVVDPVMVSTSGYPLATEETISAMKDILFKESAILTPNIPEAEKLTGREILSLEDRKSAAHIISDMFNVRSILLKGGHHEDLTDILYLAEQDSFVLLSSERVKDADLHGTGCRLSTAIACYLALQQEENPDIEEAVRKAKLWLTRNLQDNAGFVFPSFKIISKS